MHRFLSQGQYYLLPPEKVFIRCGNRTAHAHVIRRRAKDAGRSWIEWRVFEAVMALSTRVPFPDQENIGEGKGKSQKSGKNVRDDSNAFFVRCGTSPFMTRCVLLDCIRKRGMPERLKYT